MTAGRLAELQNTDRTVARRSVNLGGRKTSLTLEDPFWHAVQDIAAQRNMPVGQLLAMIERTRAANSNLSSSVRTFVIEHYRQLC